MRQGVSAKINAPSLLENELSKKAEKKEYGIISIGSATEPWMHIEEKYNLTRRCLHIIARYRFPVHCLTKSPLILRDLDILKTIDENAILPKDLEPKLRNGTLITFSFSTLDEDVREIFEPNAPRIKERLNAISKIRGTTSKLVWPSSPYSHSSQIQKIISRRWSKQQRILMWTIFSLEISPCTAPGASSTSKS